MAPGTWGEGFEDQADGFEDQADGFEDQADGFEDQADGYEDQADGFEDQADGFEDQADGKQDELSQAHANEHGHWSSIWPDRVRHRGGRLPRLTQHARMHSTASSCVSPRAQLVPIPTRSSASGPARTTTRTRRSERQSTNRFIDPTELADGDLVYTYRVRANSTEGTSPWSKYGDQDGDQLAPVGVRLPLPPTPTRVVNQTVTRLRRPVCSPTTLTRTARSALHRTQGSARDRPGTRNADAERWMGRLLTRSASGFSGIDTFVYKVDDGLSVAPDLPAVPLSSFSADMTVTITVQRRRRARSSFTVTAQRSS